MKVSKKVSWNIRFIYV